jgi:hypothetical protein
VSNYLYDLTTPVGTKVDRPGQGSSLPANQILPASEVNALVAALNDLRTAHLNGEIRTNPLGTTTTSSAGALRLRLGSNGDIEVSENGNAFRRLQSMNLHNPFAWGAVGDGVHDDTAAIKAAIDYALQTGKGKVELGGGVFKVTDTIHLGYGQTFNSIQFEGQGYLYGGEGGNTGPFNGSAILVTFSDRPVFNFQGARGSVLRGLAIKGPLTTWIDAHQLTTVDPSAGPLIDDTDPANWQDPSLSANADSQHAPAAAITIDAFSGPRPVVSYPDMTYPAWTGITGQYLKPYSSDVLIEDVQISGFSVAIAVQPSDADGNGDYTNMRRVNIDRCKYGISIGNTQSRSVAMDDVKMGAVYCCFTNTKHGRQSGKFQGFIKNLSVGQNIKIFELTTAYAGPLVISNFYQEAGWSIGTAYMGSSNEQPIVFDGGIFGFEDQNDRRGYPISHIGGPGTPINIIFRGCSFNNFKSVLPIAAVGVKLVDCNVNSQERDITNLPHPYITIAHNATCGGIILPYLGSNAGNSFKWKPFDLSNGNQQSATLMDRRYGGTGRNSCIPLYCYDYQASADYNDSLVAPHPTGAIAKNTLTSCTISGKTLTVVFASLPTWQSELMGPANGDIIWDDASGLTFFVRSVSGTTVTAELQHGYKSNGSGGWTLLTSFSSTVGNLYWRNCRFYCPTYPLLADLTSGSAVLANAGRDDGYGSFIAEVQVGDRLWVDQYKDNFMDPTNSAVSSVTPGSPGSITLASNITRSSSRKRLPLWIRKPPVNE